MTKREEYRRKLKELKEWDSYLLEHSGLPGPRGNIELGQAVADEGAPELFEKYLSYSAERAPVNSREEFLAFCGILGLGRLLAEGDLSKLPRLRQAASDPRWRAREAVAMALQRWGGQDSQSLLREMRTWAKGRPLEQRAAAAALCEPALLEEPDIARGALQVLDEITVSIVKATDRRSEEFKVLRKGLAYCWSVAVAALPSEGKAMMEKWLGHADKDLIWIMKQNLGKKRLARVDEGWVKEWQERLRT